MATMGYGEGRDDQLATLEIESHVEAGSSSTLSSVKMH